MTAQTRTFYSVEGRRIRVSDLLDRELLGVGDELVFERPRLGETHRSTVTDRGWLRIEDGTEYRAPSKAAAAAAGINAIDGWSAWTVERLGQTLFEVRAAMIDSETEGQVGIHQRLKGLSDQTEIVVDDLLSWWGADRRDRDVVNAIKADLANHGLISRPDFEKVNAQAKVILQRLSADEQAENTILGLAGDLNEEDEHELGLTLGNLPTAVTDLASVHPGATLEVAMSHMRLDKFSQLPVIDKSGTFHGAVTWESIARAAMKSDSARVSDAVVEIETHSFERELVDVLPNLIDQGFFFVEDTEGEVQGIVTMADVVSVYGDLATPFIVVGEIDHLLRRILRSCMSDAELQDHFSDDPRKVESFDDLTFGDYRNMLGKKNVWIRLETELDRKVVGQRLDDVRLMRNSLAHFEPDPLKPEQLDQLRIFLNVLRDLWSELDS